MSRWYRSHVGLVTDAKLAEAALLGEPIAVVERVFAAFADLGFVEAERIPEETWRRFKGRTSTERCRRHRARKKAALEAARAETEDAR